MSRTIGHGTGKSKTMKTQRLGWEGYDSRRPFSWCGFGKEIKKMVHRVERRRMKQEIKGGGNDNR